MTGTHRFTRQQMYDLVWSKSLVELAKDFGISANGLAKICDRLLVPHPPRGYWSGGDHTRTLERPPLLPLPDGTDSDVVISSRRAQSRRQRTRLPHEMRRDQVAEAAGRIIVGDGLAAATFKRIARELGISEALIYNYFTDQIDLFTFLARREQVLVSQMQQEAYDQNELYLDQVRGSQSRYLDYIALRGSLFQTLLSSRAVRSALREEHLSRRAWSAAFASGNFTKALGVGPQYANPATLILRAMGVRAGRVLAGQKIDRETAGRLALKTMDGARSGLLALVDRRSQATAG